jgi:hypothetical protein
VSLSSTQPILLRDVEPVCNVVQPSLGRKPNRIGQAESDLRTTRANVVKVEPRQGAAALFRPLAKEYACCDALGF